MYNAVLIAKCPLCRIHFIVTPTSLSFHKRGKCAYLVKRYRHD